MRILEVLFNLITNLFQSIGTFARIPTSTGFFDEPEIPAELLEEEK
ncbi:MULTISPECIES: cyclic lactone autoinducer peptide AgrD [Staphylococcus intermedius group]|uniref:Accessory gene regulator protein D n=2 Tax=Staphylococcus intermedius TaxID=1285 RepID=A0A380G4Y0_STAIN|nr:MULTISPECIES: cyclic lactone autoinducer peptide [Staphylococcus intermedius group]AAL65836.1 AgrD [Staphylococcus intermedius NCTC 11048]AAS66746.1 autoinducing peptide precursor [Staphylococcus intermedius]AAW67556.1 agr-autoinducing peptide precursor [Staphylococcus intermedius]ABV60477.1 type I AgrD [Staphylococcus intermedius]ABV60478.1 type I AgrD [Staphylococcus intermedius]